MNEVIIKQNNIPELVIPSIIQKLYDIAKDSSIDSVFEGSLTVISAYLSQVDYLNQEYLNLTVVMTGSPWVDFEDPLVEQILKTKYDHPNGFTISELGTYNGSGFSGSNITSFPEFKYFNTGYQLSDNFTNCSLLVSITLPQSVTKIGYGTFRNCTSLKNINLDNITQCDQISFENCGIEELNLPSLSGYYPHEWNIFPRCTSLRRILSLGTVPKIGPQMFDGCTSLETVNIPNTVTLFRAACFRSCLSLLYIEAPNVTAIENEALKGCSSLEYANFTSNQSINGHIMLPSNLTTLGDNAFNGCAQITSVDGLENTGITNLTGTFKGCTNLASINLSNIVLLNSAFNDTSLTGALNMPKLKYLRQSGGSLVWVGGFKGTTITSINCPELLEVGGPANLHQNRDDTNALFPVTLQSITLDKCTKLGTAAFDGCSNLSSIGTSTNPLAYVEVLGSYVFRSCSSLHIEVDLPSFTSVIRGTYNNGSGIFRGSGITGIKNLGTVMTFVPGDFAWGCTNLIYAIIAPLIISISNGAFNDCIHLEWVKIENPDTIVTVDNYWNGNSYRPSFYNTSCIIYVPDSLLNDYKSDSTWTAYVDATRFKTHTEFATDHPDFV